jgi:DNA-directed RNA polymerase specialized sigma subunit
LTSESSPAAQPALAAELTRDLVKELSRRERLVLMLRYTEELTVVEIAAVLEIAVTEVERMLENIAERVRRRLQPIYGRPAQRLSRA